MAMNKIPKYLDFKENLDNSEIIDIEVAQRIVVNDTARIKIKFKASREIPQKTKFRFIIPYGWEPIKLSSGFCNIKSTAKGKVKSTDSQIMLIYVLKEPLKTNGIVEFIYNELGQKNTASDIAYFDNLYCALDICLPKEKLYTRIAKKEIKMVASRANFFLVKIPTIYQGIPVDIEIVALDKFGNRDYSFNDKITIKGDKCLKFPKSAYLKNGYVKIKGALSFKNELCPKSEISILLKENKGYNNPIVVRELKNNVGRIYIKSGNIYGSSNPIIWDSDIKGQVYWGDTHIHTREFSDGIGTGKDGFLYARDVVLHDFAALGDHLNQRFNLWMEGRVMNLCPYDAETWKNLVLLCKKFTDESFVAIPAYEWSGRVFNVKNVLQLECPYEAISDKVILFPLDNANDAPLIDYISKKGCLQSQLYEALKGINCAIISHTTISWPMGTSWSEIDNNMEKVVEIYSMHGSSEEFGGGYRPLLTNRKEGSVKWALNHGLKLGFIAGGDDHYTHPGCPIRQYKLRNLVPVLRYRPGIAAIFSDKLTSNALIKSLNNRKCYGTTGKRIWIKIKINSALMGEEINVNEPPIIITTICGTNRIESVELIKNGQIIAVNVPGTDRIKFAYKDTQLRNGDSAYYYVRVTQFDGERGWSSPIWVNAKY
ncbi:MAG: hypothetical protein ACTSPY_00505 [Candidatus Helarchaeota archaeon]